MRRRSDAYEPTVDGYDVEKLASCLSARGVLTLPHEIVGVSGNGTRVDLRFDESLMVLPRWIEEARRG